MAFVVAFTLTSMSCGNWAVSNVNLMSLKHSKDVIEQELLQLHESCFCATFSLINLRVTIGIGYLSNQQPSHSHRSSSWNIFILFLWLRYDRSLISLFPFVFLHKINLAVLVDKCTVKAFIPFTAFSFVRHDIKWK